jgi:hypothetical protein
MAMLERVEEVRDAQATHRLLESQCRDLLLALALVDHKPDWLIEMIAPIRKTLAKLED